MEGQYIKGDLNTMIIGSRIKNTKEGMKSKN